MNEIEPKPKKSFLDKLFGTKESDEESLTETHKLSDAEVTKGKKSGSVKGDPIISFD